MTEVLTLAGTDITALRELLAGYALELQLVEADGKIPGSYWGEPEAGLIGYTLYARPDTPVHSLLHEACHSIVAVPARRSRIHTDASDCIAEEDAACFLQIRLADRLPGVGAARLMQDMDSWGYSFRLGSARAWFEGDAEDARAWLMERGLLA